MSTAGLLYAGAPGALLAVHMVCDTKAETSSSVGGSLIALATLAWSINNNLSQRHYLTGRSMDS